MATEATSVIERIKQKLDIVEEIGAVVPLKQSGRAFRGLCPFHGERTPSFYVYPDGHWRCFGCNEHGDLITFVEKTQGLDFIDALSLLAEKAGVALDRGRHDEASAAEAAEGSARKRLRALNEAAAIWFHAQLLQSPAAQYCRAYLDSRGVSNESIATWRLGYAPDGDQLSAYLLSQGYTPKELIEYGFSREREQGGHGGLFDYFRNRLIFPIRNQSGQTVAFGGRDLGGGPAKYLNSPQTMLFDKSATLFGLDLARSSITRADRVVIVEGYMDAIVVYQHGFRNVVAIIGSALTEKHVRVIKKLTRRVTLALDPDAAGESAMVRGISVAQRAFDRVVAPVPLAAPGPPTNRKGEPKGLVRFEEQVDAEITVARLPAHEDPDEFVRRDPEGWRAAIEQAQPLIDFLIEAETADLALDTPAGKLEARRRLMPVIAEVRDRVQAEEYVARLARKLRLDDVTLRRELPVARAQLDRETRAARQRQAEQSVADEVDGAATTRGADGAEEAPAARDGGAPGDSRDSRDSRDAGDSGGDALGVKYRQTASSLPTRGYSSSSASGGFGEHALLAEQTLEAYCLGLALEFPATWVEVSAILDGRDFLTPELRALYDALADALRSGPSLAADDFITTLHPLLRSAAEQACAMIAQRDRDVNHLVKDARDAAYRLKSLRLKGEMAELDALQREAEQAHDSESLGALLARKQQLLVQRRAIDTASAGTVGKPNKHAPRRHTV